MSAYEQPEPDTKDWTLVIDRGCDECGFDPTFARADLPRRIRANAQSWQRELTKPAARQRPAPRIWSPLEYGCHVRDVLRLYDYRLGLMLAEDDPTYPNWDQDTAAIEGGYDEDNPADVADELEAAADRIADEFAAVAGPQWQRKGRRSDDKSFTIERFGRYFLHDIEHHLYDVRRDFAPL